jgi:KDO2-lipid IV(A) lauroyltransferase
MSLEQNPRSSPESLTIESELQESRSGGAAEPSGDTGQRKRRKPDLRPSRRWLVWPLQALALAIFWQICGLLPAERASTFGRRLLRALGPWLPWHRSLRANLAVACADASPARIEELARNAWGNFGATLAEYPHLAAIAGPRFREHVDLVLCPEVAAHCARGLPAIFLTAHLGNWELVGAAGASSGVPLSAVYSRQANPLIDWMVQRRRRALGCRFVSNEAGARPLLAELAAGRSLGLLADLRVDSGEPVPFFGEAARTTLVPARLALKFGCPLVPMRSERLGGGRFRITAHPPIQPEDATADAAEQARSMMRQFNALLESWIREQPDGWQCLKRRWNKDRARRAAAVADPVARGQGA